MAAQQLPLLPPLPGTVAAASGDDDAPPPPLPGDSWHLEEEEEEEEALGGRRSGAGRPASRASGGGSTARPASASAGVPFFPRRSARSGSAGAGRNRRALRPPQPVQAFASDAAGDSTARSGSGGPD